MIEFGLASNFKCCEKLRKLLNYFFFFLTKKVISCGPQREPPPGSWARKYLDVQLTQFHVSWDQRLPIHDNKWCWSHYTILHRGNDFPWESSLEMKPHFEAKQKVFFQATWQSVIIIQDSKQIYPATNLDDEDLAEFNDWFSVFNPIHTR